MGRATPGRMDRRITIQVRTLAQDSTGQSKETWNDLAAVYAQYDMVQDTEKFSDVAAQRIAPMSARFTIRWRTDITVSPSQHRIVFSGQQWNIDDVNTMGRRDLVVIAASVKTV